MKLVRQSIWIFFFCSFLDARIFTSSDGVRKIEASITAYDQNLKMVSILRKDGKSFRSELTSFSQPDQQYILKWSEGRQENYLYVGKEYPGHLEMFQKVLDAGGIGYGPFFPNDSSRTQVMIAQGPSPFLAWVNGFEQLKKSYGKFFATQITFDLVRDKWRARISFQASRSSRVNSSLETVPSASAYGLTSVGGPILYQQTRNIVVVGEKPDPNSVVVLPRNSSPVYINPFKRGVRMNGSGITSGGYNSSNRTFRNQAGATIQISR